MISGATEATLCNIDTQIPGLRPLGQNLLFKEVPSPLLTCSRFLMPAMCWVTFSASFLPYFYVVLNEVSIANRSLFKRATTGPAWTNPAANPMVVLCDITPSDLRHILHFMYNGEVEVKQANLNTFLAVAERLRVRGLCQSGGKTSPSPPSAPSGQTRSPPPHDADRRRSSSPSPQTSSSKQSSAVQRRCSLGTAVFFV